VSDPSPGPRLPIRRARSAGGVVVRRRRGRWETLLASRRTRAGALVWGLAKGQVEEGERPEDAALREVREETGVAGRIREPLGEITYWFVWDGERVHKTVSFFLMQAAGGDTSRRDGEMEEVRWFPLDQAVRRAGFKSEREVLERAREALVGGTMPGRR